MGELVIQHLSDAAHSICRQADDLDDGLLAREAALFLVQAQASADQVNNVFGVTTIEDSEGIGKAQECGIASQHSVSERVERPSGNLVAAPAQERAGPLQHLLRSSARESEKQERNRVNPFFDHARDTVDQGAGFAAASAGQDQQGPLMGNRGFILSRVQLLLVVDEKTPWPTRFGLTVQRVSHRTALVVHLTTLPRTLNMGQP